MLQCSHAWSAQMDTQRCIYLRMKIYSLGNSSIGLYPQITHLLYVSGPQSLVSNPGKCAEECAHLVSSLNMKLCVSTIGHCWMLQQRTGLLVLCVYIVLPCLEQGII